MRFLFVIIALVFPQPLWAAESVDFSKQQLTANYYCDGINYGDFNRDGKVDVVAGPFWYEGPHFKTQHEFYPAKALQPEPSPSNSMYSFVEDFNGDGWDDILVLGRVHKHAAYWYENPKGKDTLWKQHYVFERIRGESPALVDISGDGRPEIICHWNNRWGWVAPDWGQPTKPWSFRAISEAGDWNEFYHGEGVGDVNGDGRSDLIINHGWFEQPATDQPLWTFHAFQFAERGGAQMFADDVDGDGDNDIITSLNGHGWGLAWFEQTTVDGEITFQQHDIMGTREEEAKYGVAFSQPHALDLADIDGAGLKDILCGKRMWAHGPQGDIEPGAAPVLYWF